MPPLLPRWLVRVTLGCLAFLVLAVTLWLVARALMAVLTVTASVVAALLLAALLQPLTALLERLRLPAWLAALLTILVAVAAVGGIVTLLVDRVQAQLADLGAAVEDGIDSLRHLLLRSPLPVSPERLQSAEDQVTNAFLSALPSPAGGASTATQVLSGAVLTVFLWFFFLKDGVRMWSWVLGWAPRRRAAGVDRAGRAVWDVLTRYVRGTTAVAAVDAIGIGAGMFALGVPLSASLTLIVFLSAYVPIVGAFVSGALAVGVTLITQGAVHALILLGIVLLVQQVEGNLLQPLIMGRALRLHPVAIVVSVAVGALLAGVLGAIVAVPLVAIAHRLALQARGEPEACPPDEPGTDAAT